MGRLAHPIALYVTALACLLAGPAAAQEYCVACSEPGAFVPFTNHLQITLARLVRNQDAWRACGEPLRGRNHGDVDCMRTLGAAKHQQPHTIPTRGTWFCLRCTRCPSLPHKLRAHGIPGDKRLRSEKPHAVLVRHRRGIDHGRQQPIRQARYDVLLHQQRRNASQRSKHHDWT